MARIEASTEEQVVVLSGELDISNAAVAREIVDQAIAFDRDRVVFELSNLAFMDSSGIAVLVHAANEAATVVLRNPSSIIRRTIEITGLTGTFEIQQ